MSRVRIRDLLIATASAALLAALPAAAQQEPVAPERRVEDGQPRQNRRDMESAIYETWKNILPKVEEEVDAGENAEAPLSEPEPEQVENLTYIAPVSADVENPTAVMSRQNPMIDGACRDEVDRIHRAAYANLKEVDDVVAEAEIRAHYAELRRMMSGTDKAVTPGAVFRHIAECGEFCFPRKVFLTSCHIYAVAHADRREAVFFGFNRTDVAARYRPAIDSVAGELLADPEKKLLVVGRASRPGDDDYNVRLSHLRASRVIDLLKAAGATDERITYMTIGEYAPNIDRDLLVTYKLTGVLDDIRAESAEDELNQLNQSVLMVVYEAGEEGAGHDDHDHADETAAAGPGGRATDIEALPIRR